MRKKASSRSVSARSGAAAASRRWPAPGSTWRRHGDRDGGSRGTSANQPGDGMVGRGLLFASMPEVDHLGFERRSPKVQLSAAPSAIARSRSRGVLAVVDKHREQREAAHRPPAIERDVMSGVALALEARCSACPAPRVRRGGWCWDARGRPCRRPVRPQFAQAVRRSRSLPSRRRRRCAAPVAARPCAPRSTGRVDDRRMTAPGRDRPD